MRAFIAGIILSLFVTPSHAEFPDIEKLPLEAMARIDIAIDACPRKVADYHADYWPLADNTSLRKHPRYTSERERHKHLRFRAKLADCETLWAGSEEAHTPYYIEIDLSDSRFAPLPITSETKEMATYVALINNVECKNPLFESPDWMGVLADRFQWNDDLYDPHYKKG